MDDNKDVYLQTMLHSLIRKWIDRRERLDHKDHWDGHDDRMMFLYDEIIHDLMTLRQ
jgi:hypothetical protein